MKTLDSIKSMLENLIKESNINEIENWLTEIINFINSEQDSFDENEI